MEIDKESSVKLSLTNELIKKACNLSMKPHTGQYKKHDGSVAIFTFKESMEVDDLYNDDHFGEIKVDDNLFPSLQRIGEGQLAKVNRSILEKFKKLFNNPKFIPEVEKALKKGKTVLLTGHSFGGALASLVTLWILDAYARKQKIKNPIGCVTFGSPLIGDKTVTHAVRREKWAGHFTHFVMERDIVPRMMLAPKTSIPQNLHEILKQKVNSVNTDVISFFENVLINASTVASHDAFDLMEPTNSLKETLSVDFVKVSPYRPFGDYVFCTRDSVSTPRQQLVVENPNAVLQLLFYFLQLPIGEDLAQFALESLTENSSYEEEMNTNRLQWENRVNLKDLNKHLFTSDGNCSNKLLFELTASAKWCLLAVEEVEKRKEKNKDQVKKHMRIYKINGTDQSEKIIEDLCDKIPMYKETCGKKELDYYESFKLQNEHTDFEANVDRLEQAKIWDVIIEMVMRNDLPDDFEVWDELVVSGTRFRRLYEPLDIANYYRHDKGNGYMVDNNRPKRYRFTQRWYQHANVTGFEPVSESNFVAVVEELTKEVTKPKNKTIEEVKKEFEDIEKKVKMWKLDEKIENEDVFWGEFILSELKNKLT